MNSLRERELYLETNLAGIKPHQEDLDQKVTIRNRLDELKMQLVHLTKRFSEEYPDVKKTRAEIAELEKQLAAEDATPTTQKGPPDNPTYISFSSQLASTRADVVAIRNDMLPSASRALEEAHGAYDQGAYSLTDVLAVRRTWTDWKLAHVDALANHHLAAADLAALLGNEISVEARP